ncbi:MAG: serine/threonine-protein phosphatase [Deltaproteobacteria bacterium]|nr:serine/threonine-protein phosphatase [Deltaproteobacteria bacterium]
MSDFRESFGFPLSVAVVTDVGKVRTNNEDAFGQAWLDDGSLFVHVADGMGGHEAGEVASSLATRVVEDIVAATPNTDPRERLYEGLLEANRSILEEAELAGTKGMGTTSIVGILQGAEAYMALVGDSRCFHIRKGHLMWRTLDHTRVQMLVDQGEITAEEARNHPDSGMLTRALGHARMADGRPLVPDVLSEPLILQQGDALVLSSDGLHDLVEDDEISRAVAGRSPQEAAETLVDMALQRGGHDNVTVAVVVGGRRASDFDPSFEAAWPPVAAQDEAEITYSEFPSAPVVMAPPPPVEAAGGGKTKLIVIGVVVALVVTVGLALLVALAGGAYFLM